MTKEEGRTMNAAELLAEHAAGRRYFTRTRLVGANLSGANLREANLIGANLIGSNLREANLSGANLREANLIGANLIGANLIGANLREANLREANLSGANLIGANLREADLSGANLIGANLIGANLIGANLRDAKLRDANLSGTDLSPGHTYAQISWPGHGERGRQLSAYCDGERIVFFCGGFRGSPEELAAHIETGANELRESREMTASMVRRLIDYQIARAGR